MARILIVGILFFTVCPAVSLATTRNLDALYEKASFKIGKVNIEAYVADNDQRRSQGLMYITSLPKNTGMLFIFDQEQTLSFWMKNTVMPLNIGFFDQSGALVDIQEMQMAPSLLSLKVPTQLEPLLTSTSFLLTMST